MACVLPRSEEGLSLRLVTPWTLCLVVHPDLSCDLAGERIHKNMAPLSLSLNTQQNQQYLPPENTI